MTKTKYFFTAILNSSLIPEHPVSYILLLLQIEKIREGIFHRHSALSYGAYKWLLIRRALPYLPLSSPLSHLFFFWTHYEALRPPGPRTSASRKLDHYNTIDNLAQVPPSKDIASVNLYSLTGFISSNQICSYCLNARSLLRRKSPNWPC